MAHCQYRLPLFWRQRMGGYRVNRTGAAIRFHSQPFGPALKGTQTQPKYLSCLSFARPGCNRLMPPLNVLLPYWQRGQLSSSTLPQ